MHHICWLQKQVSKVNEPQLWPLEFYASQKLTKSKTTRYTYGTYLKILTEDLTEKSRNSLSHRGPNAENEKHIKGTLCFH